MPTPYNLDVHNSCATCTVRQDHMFCNMGVDTLAAMDKVKFTSVYPKGSTLFVEGEQPRGVFVICSGRVKLTTSSSEGRTLIVRIAGPGDVLGASGAILGRPFELSAETIEPAQLNFIGRDDFLRLLTSHPEACMHAAQQLSEKYHSAQREIRSLGLSQTTSEKLARLILDWCESDGDETPRGTRLQVLLTHEEIAQMIGTTRETVTRIFSDWRRKQMIEIKGSNFFIRESQQFSDMVTVLDESDYVVCQLSQRGHRLTSIVAIEVSPVTTETALESHLLESTLLHHQFVEVWPAGRTLFYEGEEPRGVYVIHSGTVDLVFSAKDGRAKTLRVAYPGKIIGLSAVFSHRAHDYTATIRSTSDLGFINIARFHELLENTPAMLFGVLRLLSEDVNSCYDCMREIALAR